MKDKRGQLYQYFSTQYKNKPRLLRVLSARVTRIFIVDINPIWRRLDLFYYVIFVWLLEYKYYYVV